VRMINITNWPAYMDNGSGRLRTDMYDAYAAFCAQLVQIVNLDQRRGVRYFEILNEKDGDASGSYWNNQAELARIYNKAATAMRAKDSTIKIGGPAFARPDLTDQVEAFLSTINYTNFDFVSYHSYESGSTGDSNSLIWGKAQQKGRHTTNIKNIIKKYTTKNVETFHDEFNISYNPPDERMNNMKGAIFDALSVISIAKAGATGSLAWNESDGWYGKLEGWSPYNKRPSANLYNFLNTDMGGNIASTSVSDAGKVDIMGTSGGSWKKLMLVNRSEADQTIALSFSGWSTTIPDNTLFTVKRVFGWGTTYESATYAELKSNFNVWNDSITFVILDENNKTYAANPVKNPKFDAGMTDWSTSGANPEADYTETWAGRDGNHLTHWKNAAYKVYTYQTVTGLANGTYTLRAWFSSGGGQVSAQLQAKNFGGMTKTVNVPATGQYSWTQLTISNISITNGQVEIGFWSDANSNNWLYVDDVTLTKN
jgi:Glycosyl hydrolases family 39